LGYGRLVQRDILTRIVIATKLFDVIAIAPSCNQPRVRGQPMATKDFLSQRILYP
jgi:hypothetical protein